MCWQDGVYIIPAVARMWKYLLCSVFDFDKLDGFKGAVNCSLLRKTFEFLFCMA